MATYNKRGYKSPKPEVEKDPAFDTSVDEINVNENESTTAGVFNALDETANRTEEWVIRNQKAILGFILAVAIATLGYILYDKYVATPSQEEAFKEMNQAQMYFQKAVDATGTKSDSLYNLVLKGSEGKFGVVKIADEYSGTDAGNLANYYAGVAYLNTKKYAEAITSLEKFKSDDIMLSTIAIGAIGDAYAQQNKQKEALEYYVKAADANKNELTRPRYLMKAGKTALVLGNKADALKYFTDIKENYDTAPEAQSIDALIGLAQ